MKPELLRQIKKIVLLGAVMVMVLTLCGCRQRISNNSEVGNTMYDESGELSYEYEYRRDELGLSEAKRPIFPNLGSGTETQDEDSYSDYGDTENFEDWSSEDEPEYDDEDHSTTTSTGSRSSSGGRRSITRSRSRSGSNSSAIKVTLDANGGKVESDTLYVTKGGTYGTLPEPKYTGYEFLGWYTAKTDGTAVTSKTKVSSDSSHTLYAHWKEADTYTITFNANGGTISGDSTMDVTANSKLGYLPVPTRSGYTFEGWYTSADGGNRVKKGDKFTSNKDITLYAHWDEDPYTYWEGYLGDLVKAADEAVVSISDAGKTETAFLSDVKARLPKSGETASYVIKFVDKMSDADSVGNAALASNPGATVIVAPSSSLDGEKNEKLYYKYLVFYAMHGDEFQENSPVNDVKKDLEISSGEIKIYK